MQMGDLERQKKKKVEKAELICCFCAGAESNTVPNETSSKHRGAYTTLYFICTAPLKTLKGALHALKRQQRTANADIMLGSLLLC